MKRPLISIVVPVYNIEAYLDRCLASLVGQTCRGIEIVVVDDGSTDGSRAIIERYAAVDERVKPVVKRNGGVSLARRDGILASTGEYVMLVDGDDFIDPECVAMLCEVINDGVDIACLRIMRLTPEYCSPMPRKVEPETDGAGFLRNLLRHDMFAGVLGVAYRRELLEDLRFYPDVHLWEDFLMNLQIALNPLAKRVAFVDSAMYYYVQRPGSANRSKVSFDYLRSFCGKVSDVLAANPQRASRCADEILMDRIHWYLIYISKSRNPWVGDTPFAMALYSDVMEARGRLINMGVPRSVISMIRMYHSKAFMPVLRASVLVRKWRTSLARRRSARCSE